MASQPSTNGANANPTSSNPASAAIPSPQSCFNYHSPGIYIRTNGEHALFLKWLAIPHPDIHLAACIGSYIYIIPPFTFDLEAEVAATITPEQGKRFRLCAEWLDIWTGWARLAWLRKQLEEVRGVLEAILEDEMAGFDAEDFKRLEIEDRQHFGR